MISSTSWTSRATRGPGAERLLVEEFRHLAGILGELTGKEITAAGLREAALAREERRLAYLAHAEGIYGEERLRLAMDFHSPAVRRMRRPAVERGDRTTASPSCSPATCSIPRAWWPAWTVRVRGWCG